MLKATTTLRPDKELERTLISLVYAVVSMVLCLLLLFMFPAYSAWLLVGTLLTSVLSIVLAIGVLNASEEALTYGGFANEILRSSDLIKRIDNAKGEAVIINVPAQRFFAKRKVMETLSAHLTDERQNLLDFQRLELALKSLKKETVTLGLTFDKAQEWFEVSVRPIYLKKNDIFEEDFSIKKIQKDTYFLWTIQNRTAAKNMEKVFEEERKKLHRFINRMPVGIYTADAEFKLDYVNDTFAAQLGYDREYLLGRPLREFVVQNEALLDPIAPDYTGMSYVQNSDGERLELFVEQSSFRESGEVKICGLTVHNLPTDVQVREDLNRVRDERNALMDGSPLGIILTDTDWKIQQVNLRAKEMIAGSVLEAENPTLNDLPDDRLKARLKELTEPLSERKEQQMIGPIETHLTADKVIRVYAAARVLVHQKQARVLGLTLYLEDMTEQKNLEFRFAQAQKMQAMGQLAGGIAHDFNNLLTAMIGFCDLLLQRHGVGDPSFADLLQIKQNATRAAGLVLQLLAFSRKQPLKPKRLDVTENFIELSYMMKRILGEQIELSFHHGNRLGYIKVDPVQFSQVIINLAVNAKDAMNGKGRLTISTRTEKLEEPYVFGTDTIAAGDFVVISVSDTGCGIPQENLTRIFEPFFSTKQNVVGSGTGLGLATVYGIVRQTEGFIKVDSTLGKGTTFSIYLPRFEKAEEDETASTAVETAPKAEPQVATGFSKVIMGLNLSTIDHHRDTYRNPQDVRILFVEDEDSVRAFGVRALKKKGFKVTACNSAESAIELLDQGETFNLLVTDMMMPGMNGTDLAREMKRRQPNVRIILASGYSEEIARRELGNADDFEFIAKPYSLGDLSKKVSEILEKGDA